MHRVVLREIPLRPNRFGGLAGGIHWIFFTLFVGQVALVWLRLWLPAAPFGDARWPEGVLVVLTAATTLASLTRQLPGQNVVAASLMIAIIGGSLEALGAQAAVPFGPFEYTAEIGQRLFEPLPWAVPLLWLILILNGRGVARLVLRPWRRSRSYGFWLIGLTTLLVVLFDLGLEPFATSVKHYWLWHPTKTAIQWYGAPWVNFFSWAVIILLILVFVTPFLLIKRPGQNAPCYHPLVVWLMLNLLLVTGLAAHRLWPAVLLVSIQSALVAALGMMVAMRERP